MVRLADKSKGRHKGAMMHEKTFAPFQQKKIFLYISREFLLSLFISFCFFFVVFFINQILLMVEEILSKNVPLHKTLLLLFYSLPSIVTISFPFSALAGGLMASARLNSDNEFLAMAASGISIRTMYLPFVIIGLISSFVSFQSNDYFLPRGTKEFQREYGRLVAKSASIELSAYSVKNYAMMTIVTGEKMDDAIGAVLLYPQNSIPGVSSKTLISAEKARFSISPDQYNALVTMDSVWQQEIDSKKPNHFSISRAEQVQYRIKISEPIAGFSSAGPAEMSSAQINVKIAEKTVNLEKRISDSRMQKSRTRVRLISAYGNELSSRTIEAGSVKTDKTKNNPAEAPLVALAKSTNEYRASATAIPQDRTLQIYKLEYHKKFSIPAAGFFFSLLAFPLGLGTGKAGRTAGFGLALLLSVVYWALLFSGQTLGLRSTIEPGLAMWAPNLLVLAATVLMLALRHFSSRRFL